MKITKRQLKRIIKEEKRKLLKEYFPISGDPPKNGNWPKFKQAVWDCAAEYVDAGFPKDGMLDAMLDEVRQVFKGIDEVDEDDWDDGGEEWTTRNY